MQVFSFEDIMNRIDSNEYILDLKNNSEEKNKTENKDLYNSIPYYRRVRRCEFCGSKYTLSNKSRHERSTKHFDGKYISTERFEMT